MGKLERTEIWVLKKFLYIQIHSSIIYDSPNREILQVSNDRWLYNIISWTQNDKYTRVVAMHTFNPCTWEAKAGGSVSSKPVCSTKRVPGLHAEKQANKQDKYYAILIKWIQIHRIQKEKADHQRWEGGGVEGKKRNYCAWYIVSVLQERVLETITQRHVTNVKMHALCFHWFFFETGSLIFQTLSYYAAENVLKPLIPLPLLPKCWHYKSIPPCSALGIVMIYMNLCIPNIGD